MKKVLLPVCISILSANGLNAQIASYTGVDEMLDDSQKIIDMNRNNKPPVNRKVLLKCIEDFQNTPKIEFNPYPNYGMSI